MMQKGSPNYKTRKIGSTGTNDFVCSFIYSLHNTSDDNVELKFDEGDTIDLEPDEHLKNLAISCSTVEVTSMPGSGGLKIIGRDE